MCFVYNPGHVRVNTVVANGWRHAICNYHVDLDQSTSNQSTWVLQCNVYPGLILDLGPANERRRYEVTPPLIGWAQT